MMIDALHEVEFNVRARAANRPDEFGYQYGIHRGVCRALPDLDGTGWDHHTLALGIDKRARFVRIEADGVFLAPFIGGETVNFFQTVMGAGTAVLFGLFLIPGANAVVYCIL